MHGQLRIVRRGIVLYKFKSKTLVVLDNSWVGSPGIHADTGKSLFPAVRKCPVQYDSKKLLPFEGRVNHNPMQVDRITFFHVSPNYWISIANAERDCDRGVNNYFVLVFVFNILNDRSLVIVPPHRITV